MLNYLGWKEAADLVEKGIIECINEKIVTYDLARQMPDIKPVKTSEFAEQIVNRIKQKQIKRALSINKHKII